LIFRLLFGIAKLLFIIEQSETIYISARNLLSEKIDNFPKLVCNLFGIFIFFPKTFSRYFSKICKKL